MDYKTSRGEIFEINGTTVSEAEFNRLKKTLVISDSNTGEIHMDSGNILTYDVADPVGGKHFRYWETYVDDKLIYSIDEIKNSD